MLEEARGGTRILDAVDVCFFLVNLCWSLKEECGGERDHKGPCSGLMPSKLLMKMIGGLKMSHPVPPCGFTIFT